MMLRYYNDDRLKGGGVGISCCPEEKFTREVCCVTEILSMTNEGFSCKFPEQESFQWSIRPDESVP